jgi:hypothetical protein
MNQVLTTIEEPARGPAADEGVRPTIDADGLELGKLCGIGQSCLQAAFQAAGPAGKPACSQDWLPHLISAGI